MVKSSGKASGTREPGAAARGGDARIGPVMAIPSLLVERGLDPVRVFASVGLDPSLMSEPDNRISFQDFGRLLEACAAATGCPHFGLMAVERYNRNSVGAVGNLVRSSPTVGDALRCLQLHLHLNDRGAVPSLLRLDADRVALVYTLYGHNTAAAALIYDAALGVTHGILRELCGPSWRPLAVQFAHRAPKATQPYRQFFGVRPEFDAARSAIVFASAWLDRHIPGADPRLHEAFATTIHKQEASEPDSISFQVRRAVYPMVLSGTATLPRAARFFSLHERTFRRRLKADGATFHGLLNEARFALAQQLLRDTSLPAAEIAAILGYANPGAFSRAFRGWSGTAPRQWRDRESPSLPSPHSASAAACGEQAI